MVEVSSVIAIVLNVGIIILLSALFAGLFGVCLYFFLKWKQYQQYKCFIFEKDGLGQQTIIEDNAGIFVDNKTKNKRFFMKKNNVGLDPNNVPFLQGNRKFVFLVKTGLKNFSFVNMNVEANSLKYRVGEEDINWGTNAYERSKKMNPLGMFMQMLPYLALMFTGVMILVMYIYLFKNIVTITPALQGVAEALKESAQAFAQAQSGTVVIPSVP